MRRPEPTLAQKLQVALYRAKVGAAKALRLPVDYTPPAGVGRDHLAATALLWDGRWFLKAKEAHGEDAARALNSAVRVSFARTEMKLLLAALGRRRADDLTEAAAMVRGHANSLLRPAGGLDYSERRNADGSLAVSVKKCAAYEGAAEAHRRGIVTQKDQACIHCKEVWGAWLGELLPDHDLEVERGDYQGGGAPTCEFRVNARPRSAR